MKIYSSSGSPSTEVECTYVEPIAREVNSPIIQLAIGKFYD